MAPRFEKFTVKAREAVQAAQSIANEHEHQSIEPEHLLLALLRQREGVVGPVLAKLGVRPESIKAALETELGRMPKVRGSAERPRLSVFRSNRGISAQLIDRHGMASADMPVGSLDSAYRTLLDVRTELHRVSGRGRDQLLAQFADEISADLGVGDRFDLARLLSGAGRTISYHTVTGLRTAANALPRRGISALVRRPKRRPIDEGVVEYAGEIVLARDAQPERDPGLVLAAVENGVNVIQSDLEAGLAGFVKGVSLRTPGAS